jgi:hypothetical protein
LRIKRLYFAHAASARFAARGTDIALFSMTGPQGCEQGSLRVIFIIGREKPWIF